MATKKTKPKKKNKIQKIRSKGLMYWFPRVILVLYPTIMIAQPIISSFSGGGLSIPGTILILMLAAFASGFIITAWTWPQVGGVIVTFVGIATILGANSPDLGMDWRSVVLTGGPITLAGILFLIEGYTPYFKKAKRNNKKTKTNKKK